MPGVGFSPTSAPARSSNSARVCRFEDARTRAYSTRISREGMLMEIWYASIRRDAAGDDPRLLLRVRAVARPHRAAHHAPANHHHNLQSPMSSSVGCASSGTFVRVRGLSARCASRFSFAISCASAAHVRHDAHVERPCVVVTR